MDEHQLCVVALAAMNERENDGFGDNPEYLLPAVRAVLDALDAAPCAHQWLPDVGTFWDDDHQPVGIRTFGAWCPECGETREAP